MEEPALQFVLGKELRGWLRRQGGMMRGWQRKFFILKDGYLFCLNREDDTRMHTYLLYDYQLKEVPTSSDDPDKFAFELVPDSEKCTGEAMVLCAASDAERKEWIKGLCYHIYASRGGAIFGLPLAETMKYEHKKGRSIPYIVEACVKHLSTNAMQTEGIFRLAGRAGLLKELRGKYETGQKPSLDDVDVHTVGSLLKAYLRDMPQSLVPPDLYQRAMNCAMRYSEANSDDVRSAEVLCLSNMLEDLPDVNYATLAYICRFLHRLAENSESTKMTAHNLSLVFGPNLIRHLDNSPELLMLTADLTQHLAFMLIEHCSEILPVRPSKESVPSPPSEESGQSVVDNVPTGDLLGMSDNSAVSTQSVPRPDALGDLAGLDWSRQLSEGCDSGRSSATPPSSPFVMVDHQSDNAGFGLLDGVSDKAQASPSGSMGGGLDAADRGSTGSLGKDGKPVPPKRSKSRTLRNRRSAAAAPQSPLSPESPRQLDSQDILTALASVTVGQGSAVRLPQAPGSGEATSKDATSETGAQKGSEGETKTGNSSHGPRITKRHGVICSGDPSATTTADGVDKTNDFSTHQSSITVKLLPTSTENQSSTVQAGNKVTTDGATSQKDLEAQVAALKAKLVATKSQSERKVAALKKQLEEVRSRYDTMIANLEKQHKSKVIDLKAKLDAERSARADAVEKTVNLQAQLYRYKMQYGEQKDF